MIVKRRHKNTVRLTAKERAVKVVNDWVRSGMSYEALKVRVQEAITAGVRQADARQKLRKAK